MGILLASRQESAHGTMSPKHPFSDFDGRGRTTTMDLHRPVWMHPSSSLWHIRARVLGGGGEIFFPLPATFCARRPETIIILNLRSDPNSAWNQQLPPNWRDIELRIASSIEFQEEFLSYKPTDGEPRRITTDIEDALSREDFAACAASAEIDGLDELMISHSSTSSNGLSMKFEYLFGAIQAQAAASKQWQLRDVTVVIQPLTN